MADEFAGFRPPSDEWADFKEAPQSSLMQEMKDVPAGAVAGAKEYAHGLGNVAQTVAATAFPSIDPGAAAGREPESQGGSPGFNFGRFMGGAAAAAPVAYLMPGSMSEYLPARVLSGAASGALTGAAESPGNMGPGAVTGAVGGAVPGVVPGISSEAQALLQKGIRPSLGQSVGGWLNDLEQEAMSVPGAGDMIKYIRRRAVNDLNISQANAALSHIGESLDPKTAPGRGMIAEIGRKGGDYFDQLLQHVTWQPDPQTVPNLTSIIQNANLTPKYEAQLTNLIKTQFGKAGTGNTMPGQLFKEVDSKFGQEAADYMGKLDADQSKYGRAVMAVQAELRDTLARTNPQWGDELNKANATWADFKRLEYAAGNAKEGVFSPAQLTAGVKHEALTKGQYAKGQARMQDVSDLAEKVLGPTVPDSGTAARIMLGVGTPLMAGSALAGTMPEAAPYAGAAALANLAGVLGYTPPAQAAARTLMRLAPYARPGVSAGFAGLLGQPKQ